MADSARPISLGSADDLWHQHEAQIKDLYQNQRKTLREVKQIMEESGFPKTPLSTWESKLREQLQLRKKAKSHDWPLIYRHVLPRLEHPRKKRLKRKTIIRLNGSEIPWDKAWKEIRRSGALGKALHSTTPSPLPLEVTIRSPSPVPIASSGNSPAPVTTRSSNIPSAALVTSHDSVVMPPSRERSLTYAFSVYLLQWCASRIPWLEVYQSVQHMFRDDKHTRKLEMSFSSLSNEFLATSPNARAFRAHIRRGIISSDTRLDLFSDDQPMPPRPSPDLGYRVAKSGGQIRLGQFISTAIFLLANNLHDPGDCDGGLELLCSFIDCDTCLTTTFLQCHTLSIRAAWKSLLEFSIHQKRKNTFKALTDIGISNSWLGSVPPKYFLRGAVQMDCYDIVFKLVGYYRELNHSHWWRHSFDAILLACRKGNVECASLLVQHCNVNAAKVRSQKDQSMFQDLIASLGGGNTDHALALELFLARGANVDENSASERLTHRWRGLVGQHELLQVTRPTILDELFYMNRSIFNKARSYSSVPASRITRTGLLVALEDGSQTLRAYVSARQPGLIPLDSRHVQPFLELLLAEQFDIARTVDMKILRGLFELGVNFKMPSVRLDMQDFGRIRVFSSKWEAQHLDFALDQFATTKERMELLHMFLSQGADIGEYVLEGFVAHYGTVGLECLATQVADFKTKAVRALVRAARLNNYQDVEFLLRQGVDPNAFVIANGLKSSIQAVVTQACSFPRNIDQLPDGGCSLEMIQFLARYGARLVVTPNDSTPFDFAKHLLRRSTSYDLLAKVKYALGTIAKDGTSRRLPSFLLESCMMRGGTFQEKQVRLKIFEYLFRTGAEVTPGSPLAVLVDIDGREELVREVLYSGSDLNAYCSLGPFTPLQIAANKGSENLVRLFVHEGANVNAPAYGPDGMTALHALCEWSPATEEEHQSKMRLCLFLIGHGADVNPARPEGGNTMLISAALRGDLELAALLLREGADVNATSSSGTALDHAASLGRLDMVTLLLNANALSCVRGTTGYDGAIYKAGLSAIADLIREHAAKVEAGTVFNPELLKPPEACRTYGFGVDEEMRCEKESSSDDNGHGIAVSGDI